MLDDLENRGVRLPNNFNLLGKRHLLFLQGLGVPTPYSELVVAEGGILSRKGLLSETQIEGLTSHEETASFPKLFIAKPVDGHHGEGIEMLDEQELSSFRTEREAGTIIQPFLYPPEGRDCMEDYRVLTIKGEPRGWYGRRAPEPLIDSHTGQLIESLPSPSRFLTDVSRGGEVIEPPRRMRGKVFRLARETCAEVKSFASVVRSDYMRMSSSEEVNLGLMSVDVILREDIEPVVCEVDTSPSLGGYPDLSRLSRSYTTECLKELSENGERPILLFKEPFPTAFPANTLLPHIRQEGLPFMIAGLGTTRLDE